jgi:hypothetical protein
MCHTQNAAAFHPRSQPEQVRKTKRPRNAKDTPEIPAAGIWLFCQAGEAHHDF